MADELTFFQSVIVALISVIATALVSTIIWYLKTKGECFKAWTNKVDKLDKRSFRIQKAIILMATLIDQQTEKAHPGLSSELEELTKEMLTDSEGKL